MTSLTPRHHKQVGQLSLSLVCAIAWSVGGLKPSQAQIVPDGTLPTPSSTSVAGSTTTIRGGSQAGANLFHSFDQFSIGAGATASFQSNATIERILTRVTGGSPSLIDGSLEVLGSNADFFLLNPNGVLFGPDASLNLNGSFMATTGERLQFADGSFDAVNPSSPSLLSVSAPVGVNFGGAPAPIQVNGPGHGLLVNQNSEIIKTNRPLGLQVQPQQTLALLGGPVIFDGGNVTGGDATVGAGRVAIAGIGAGGNVDLTPDALGWQVDASGSNSFNDVILQNAASVDASSLGGGTIDVYGQNIVLSEGSTLLSETLGSGSGAAITIQGSEAVVLTGIFQDANTGQPFLPSSFVAEVVAGANGQGGALNLTAPLLLLQDGAQVSTSTYGAGDSGDMTINVQQLGLIGANAFGPSSLGSVVGFTSTGSSGDISVTADEIVGQGSGSITTFAFGPGQGGRIFVKASDVSFNGGSAAGPSGIFAGAILGQGGGLELESDRLTVSGGAQIAANTFGPGNGADITIRSQEIDLSGTSPNGNPTGILTGVERDNAPGSAGNIFLQAEQIRVGEGARIAVNTLGPGDAGVLMIEATQMDLEGAVLTPQGPKYSGLFATVDPTATGQGGQIVLDVDTLNVSDGARVLAATAGAGDAGDVTINANEVNLVGQNELGPSSLLTSAIVGPGAGGTIEVNANELNATDGAVISASNFLIGTGAPPGQGPAGVVILNVDQLTLSDEAQVTTASAGGAEGDIEINANILTLRRGGNINANAFGPAPGGNIAIDANFIIALADENSDITANAVDNRGGNVQIRTGNLLGIQPRADVTPGSDITASSALGVEFAGSIVLNEMEVNPAQGLAPLPKEVIDPSEKVAQSCPGDLIQAGSSFRISGRGGLAASEQQVLASLQVWQDDRDLSLGNVEAAIAPADSPSPDEATVSDGTSAPLPLQEAHELTRDRQGRIQLLASTGTMNPAPYVSCQG